MLLSPLPLRALVPSLVVAAVMAVPAAAQDWKGQGRLEGKVTGPDGKPIEGATHKLDNPERGGGPTVKTDKKGKWAYLGLAAGNWNIDVEADGFTTRRISYALATETSRTAIEIKLEKAAPKGPPPEVVAALAKADTAFKEGRFDEAVAEFERLLAMRPDLATEIHRQLGVAHIRLKNYPKALEHLQKVMDAEPANPQIRVIAGMAAVEGGLLDRGAEIHKGLDESAIKDPDVFFNIGVAFTNANRPEDAIVYFGKSIALDAAYVDGYFRRGIAYIQLGKNAEAKADLAKVVELKPTGPEADLAKKAIQQLK
jgi:tetratricopeptide (TPR) repeat protein